MTVADHQTAGRGRMGRAWTAPAGSSLLVSILFRPHMAPSRAHLVTMAAGLAACEGVFLAAGFTPSLKWPNDLVVGGRKLAGMLSEAETSAGALDALVVGIGINVDWRDFPPEIAETATACNLVTGERVDRAELLVRLLERLDERYSTLLAPGGDQVVLGEYRRRCATIGQEVRVELAHDVLKGRAVAVADAGELVLEAPDGTVSSVSVGDVVHAS